MRWCSLIKRTPPFREGPASLYSLRKEEARNLCPAQDVRDIRTGKQGCTWGRTRIRKSSITPRSLLLKGHLSIFTTVRTRLLSPRFTYDSPNPQRFQTLNPDSWLAANIGGNSPQATGLSVYSHRANVKVCVRERAWIFVDEICSESATLACLSVQLPTQRTFARTRASRRAVDRARPVST